MREPRIVFVFVFGLLAAVLSVSVSARAAQGEQKKDEPGRPDLSGEWVLDRARSSRAEYDMHMTVIHREPEMRVKKIVARNGRESVEECAYYTDGRKEKKADIGCRDSESLSARWQGRKLVRKSRRFTKGVMKLDMVTTEEWELSADGKTLTLTVMNMEALSTNQRILPRMQVKHVFKRGS